MENKTKKWQKSIVKHKLLTRDVTYHKHQRYGENMDDKIQFFPVSIVKTVLHFLL